MNVKQLIEKYENILKKSVPFTVVNIHGVLRDLKQLDEPQKVVVPQFVADWYEEYKDDFEFNIWDWVAYSDESEKLENKEFNSWINDSEGNPIQTLVNMHQFGYEVEKEKRYTVVMKETKQPLYYNAVDKKLFFSMGGLATQFTRKRLEEANFGWVFDCEGIEIEEVE